MSDIGQKIIAEVRRIAAENPNYVYSPPDDPSGVRYKSGSCYYMHDDGPGCIMGRALFSLGYLPAAPHIEAEGKSVGPLILRLGLPVDQSEIRWLEYVQAAQDGRAIITRPISENQRQSWSQSIAYADESVGVLAS